MKSLEKLRELVLKRDTAVFGALWGPGPLKNSRNMQADYRIKHTHEMGL